MVHGRSNGWLLWARGAVLSTVTRSVLSLSGCGDGGDMAGGQKLSAVGECSNFKIFLRTRKIMVMA